MTGISQSAGNTCYYDVVAEGSWTPESRMHIYPGEMTNVDVYIANGTSRIMAQEFYGNINAEKDYSFIPG